MPLSDCKFVNTIRFKIYFYVIYLSYVPNRFSALVSRQIQAVLSWIKLCGFSNNMKNKYNTCKLLYRCCLFHGLVKKDMTHSSGGCKIQRNNWRFAIIASFCTMVANRCLLIDDCHGRMLIADACISTSLIISGFSIHPIVLLYVLVYC